MKRFVKITSCVAVILLLALVCLALFGCQSNVDANKRRHINSVNHRGYNDAPENTLAAFRLSKEMGFDMVECDVNFTKDSRPVLLHDSSVNRTSNGKGKITELTLNEVRQLDFGSWKSDAYAGERIPTFEEFVELCVELELHPYVEIKSGATLQQTRQLVEIVDKSNLSLTWIGRDKDVLTLISQLRSGDRIGLLTEVIVYDTVRFLMDLSKTTEVFVDCMYTTLTKNQINLCKVFRIPLEVWTVNSQSTIENINPYITGVTSDYVIAQQVFNNL